MNLPPGHIVMAVLMGLVTSGFTSLGLHEVTLLAPSFFALWLLFVAASGDDVRVRPLWFLVPTILILLAIMSTGASNGKFTSMVHAISMFFPLYALTISSNKSRQLVWTYTLATSWMILGWIVYVLTHLEEIKAWSIDGLGGSCNLLSCEINMLLPFLYQMHQRGKGLMKTMAGASMALGVAAVFMLMSRSGIAALFCNLILLFMFNHRRAALTIAGLILLSTQVFPETIHVDTIRDTLSRFRFIEYEASAPRHVIWNVSYDAWAERPWMGVGPGNSDLALSAIDINHSHNNVIQVGLEMGLVAAILLLVVKLYAGGVTLRLLLGNQKRLVAGLPVLSYLAYSITASPIQHPEVTLLLIFTITHAMALADEPQEEHTTRPNAAPAVLPNQMPVWS